jgi:hypothetical protein
MSTHSSIHNLSQFRESMGFKAGQEHERRRIGELIRQRISSLQLIDGVADHRQPSQRSLRAVIAELRRISAVIEEAA